MLFIVLLIYIYFKATEFNCYISFNVQGEFLNVEIPTDQMYELGYLFRYALFGIDDVRVISYIEEPCGLFV